MTAVAFSPDGSMLAVACGATVTLWDPDTNSLVSLLAQAAPAQVWPLLAWFLLPCKPLQPAYAAIMRALIALFICCLLTGALLQCAQQLLVSVTEPSICASPSQTGVGGRGR